MNNRSYPRPLRLRDGGEPVPPVFGRAPTGPAHGMPAQVNMVQRPEGPSYAQPYIDRAEQFDQEYPVVGQVAQLVNQPLNIAAGVYGMGKAAVDGNVPGMAANALSMVPLAGRWAKKAVLAGTAKSINQYRGAATMGLRPTGDMAATAARRIGGDAGTAAQAVQLGDATYQQTTNSLRNGGRK